MHTLIPTHILKAYCKSLHWTMTSVWLKARCYSFSFRYHYKCLVSPRGTTVNAKQSQNCSDLTDSFKAFLILSSGFAAPLATHQTTHWAKLCCWPLPARRMCSPQLVCARPRDSLHACEGHLLRGHCAWSCRVGKRRRTTPRISSASRLA